MATNVELKKKLRFLRAELKRVQLAAGQDTDRLTWLETNAQSVTPQMGGKWLPAWVLVSTEPGLRNAIDQLRNTPTGPALHHMLDGRVLTEKQVRKADNPKRRRK